MTRRRLLAIAALMLAPLALLSAGRVASRSGLAPARAAGRLRAGWGKGMRIPPIPSRSGAVQAPCPTIRG